MDFPLPNVYICFRQFPSYLLFLCISLPQMEQVSLSLTKTIPGKKSHPLPCFPHTELLLSLPVAALSLSTGSSRSAYKLHQGFQIVKGKKRKRSFPSVPHTLLTSIYLSHLFESRSSQSSYLQGTLRDFFTPLFHFNSFKAGSCSTDTALAELSNDLHLYLQVQQTPRFIGVVTCQWHLTLWTTSSFKHTHPHTHTHIHFLVCISTVQTPDLLPSALAV